MRSLSSKLTLALAAALAHPHAAAPQKVPARFAHVADSLRRLVDSAHVVPSLTVAVVSRDGIVWEQGFGYADVERGVRADPTIAYPAASVAKSLTAVAALRAAERHELELDAPVSRYLGPHAIDVRMGDPDRLTTRTLLQMTAGIPHLVRFRWPDAPQDTMVHGSLAHFTAFPPGDHFHYSNQSLGIVGEILARASRTPFDEYMAREVFRPLGLFSTAVRGDALPAERVARTYSSAPFKPLGFVRLELEPGAGVFTSAHDLALLARALFLRPDRNFVSDSARESFLRFDVYPFYWLGWWRDPGHPDDTMLMADGAAYGHAASLKIFPAHGVAVAVLTNGSARDGFTLELCDLLLAAADSALPAGKPYPEAFLPKPHTTFAGEWTGTISLANGTVPVRWVVAPGDSARSAVGADALARTRYAEVQDGMLEAGIAGMLPASETAGQPNRLAIKLRRFGAVLAGYVTAQVSLGERPFLVLPFPVCLWRTRDGVPVDGRGPKVRPRRRHDSCRGNPT